MVDIKRSHRKEKDALVEDFSKQVNELEEKLGEKMREVDLMHSELKLVKEFRRKRGQMQKELEDVSFYIMYSTMGISNRIYLLTIF